MAINFIDSNLVSDQIAGNEDRRQKRDAAALNQFVAQDAVLRQQANDKMYGDMATAAAIPEAPQVAEPVALPPDQAGPPKPMQAINAAPQRSAYARMADVAKANPYGGTTRLKLIEQDQAQRQAHDVKVMDLMQNADPQALKFYIERNGLAGDPGYAKLLSDPNALAGTMGIAHALKAKGITGELAFHTQAEALGLLASGAAKSAGDAVNQAVRKVSQRAISAPTGQPFMDDNGVLHTMNKSGQATPVTYAQQGGQPVRGFKAAAGGDGLKQDEARRKVHNDISDDARRSVVDADGKTDPERFGPVNALAQKIYDAGQANSAGQAVYAAQIALQDAEFSPQRALMRAQADLLEIKKRQGVGGIFGNSFESISGGKSEEEWVQLAAGEYLAKGNRVMGSISSGSRPNGPREGSVFIDKTTGKPAVFRNGDMVPLPQGAAPPAASPPAKATPAAMPVAKRATPEEIAAANKAGVTSGRQQIEDYTTRFAQGLEGIKQYVADQQAESDVKYFDRLLPVLRSDPNRWSAGNAAALARAVRANPSLRAKLTADEINIINGATNGALRGE